MFNLFAHSAEVESMEDMATWGDLTPIFVGGGIVVAVLLAIIIYMTLAWEPKKRSNTPPKK
jgi:hypothetical protein